MWRSWSEINKKTFFDEKCLILGVAVTCNVLYVTISQIINVKMYKNLIICNFCTRKKKQNELCEKLRGSRDPKLNPFCSLESYAVTYEPAFEFSFLTEVMIF